METKDKKQKEAAPEMDNGKLREFFIEELKDIYWAEKALCKALPELMKASTNKKLGEAFDKHTQETEGQIEILEQVFQLLGEKAVGKKCEAMEGLVKEAHSVIEETEEGTYTRDVGLIMASQKAEHYEIASYGALIALAQQLNETKAADLLQKILDEEKKTDITLSIVAESQVNEKATGE